MITFYCPDCGQKIAVQPKQAGKAGQCTRCHVPIRVPLTSQPPPAPDPGPGEIDYRPPPPPPRPPQPPEERPSVWPIIGRIIAGLVYLLIAGSVLFSGCGLPRRLDACETIMQQQLVMLDAIRDLLALGLLAGGFVITVRLLNGGWRHM